MKVLVTGGAGFIGSNLALALQERGDQVTLIDNFRSGHRENLKSFRGEVITQDIVDCFLDRWVPDAKAIFHQAAITDTTLTDPEQMNQCNVEGFRNILQFAAQRQIPVVYASSAGVYGNSKIPMREKQEVKPLNPYASSKVAMDHLAREFIKKENIPLIIGLRYFNVFGPREQFKGKAASMIYQLAQQIGQKKRPRIFLDGEQKRDHIYVKDIILANLQALSAKKNGIVNIGTGIATTFNQLVEILNRVLKTNLEPDYFKNPYVGVYQDETLADTRTAEELFGFKAEYSIEEGIREYLLADSI